MLIRRVVITSPQLLALRATPINILAAPGATRVIVPISEVFIYRFNTTPYTLPAPGSFQMVYGNPPVMGIALTPAALFLDQATNRFVWGGMDTFDTPVPLAAAANQPIAVWNTSAAEWTLGDGTVEIVMAYYLADT